MRITHKIHVEEDFTDDIICNKCGNTCLPIKECGGEGLIEASVCGGYGSEIIGDGDSLTFSICERCLIEIILDFRIPPEHDDMDGEEFSHTEWCDRMRKNLRRKDTRKPWKS